MALLSVIPALVAFSGTAQAACDDPAQLVDQVEQAVLDARFEDARTVTDQAEAAFGCTGQADSTLLARVWLAEGAMAHIEGDEDARDQAFASAWRIAPSVWTAAFGDDLKTHWSQAQSQERGMGQLQLEGLSEGQVALVDGKPITVPAELESGLYLVQADDDGGPPAFARIVLVPSDQTLVVRVEQDLSASQTSLMAESPKRNGKWAWFAGAGASAVLAGTSAILATSQDNGMTDAGNIDDLSSAYGRQRAFSYTSYSLAGVSAACLGVGIVW